MAKIVENPLVANRGQTGGDLELVENGSVCSFCCPRYAQHCLPTPHFKSLDLIPVNYTHRPCFRTVEKDGRSIFQYGSETPTTLQTYVTIGHISFNLRCFRKCFVLL